MNHCGLRSEMSPTDKKSTALNLNHVFILVLRTREVSTLNLGFP